MTPLITRYFAWRAYKAELARFRTSDVERAGKLRSYREALAALPPASSYPSHAAHKRAVDAARRRVYRAA